MHKEQRVSILTGGISYSARREKSATFERGYFRDAIFQNYKLPRRAVTRR